MGSESATLQQQIGDIRRRVQELTGGLAPEQLILRPDPAKWSIAECLAHLNATAGVLQRLMSKAIEHGKVGQKFGKGPFKLGIRGRLLIWIAEPPPKFRIPAPKSILPPVDIPDPARVLDEFMKAQEEWLRLWQEAEGLDLARINIGGALSPFRCHVSASFPWMMAHQRRHLWQAENVKRQIEARPAAA